MRSKAIFVAAALPVLLAGCLTHMRAPRDARHTEIDWRDNYWAARSDAMASDRPILLVMIAGEREGLC